MMTIRHAVAALAVATVVAGCGSAEKEFIESGAAPLAADDLQVLLTGNTIAGRGEADFYMFFGPDGQVKGRWSTGPEAGTWSVDKDKLCIQWQNTKREHGCQKAYRDGNRYAVVDTDGDLHYRFSIIEGNPQGM